MMHFFLSGQKADKSKNGQRMQRGEEFHGIQSSKDSEVQNLLDDI